MIKSKNYLKMAIMLGLALLFVLILSNNVSATVYSDSNKDVIITITDDLGISGTKTITHRGTTDALISYTDIIGVNQAKLNEYAKTPKSIMASVKVKIPNDIEKAIWVEPKEDENGFVWDENDNKVYDEKEEAKIELIDNNKYVSYSCELKYINVEDDRRKPIDNNIASISFLYPAELSASKEMKLVKANGNYDIFYVENNITLQSENVAPIYDVKYVNKYGKPYPAGGMGDRCFINKIYLTSNWEIEGRYGFQELYHLPTNVNLAEAYMQLEINVFQGDSIVVDGLGTLNYAGIIQKDTYRYGNAVPTKFYVYKNSLNNLKKLSKAVTFKANTTSGYTLDRGIYYGWQPSDDVQEETITGTINTENKDTSIKMNIVGTGNAKFKSIDIQKNDTLYIKLEEGLQETISDKYEAIPLGVFDISVIEGAYNGKLNLTFDVGTKYNGRQCWIGHLKNGLNYEQYEAKVENGKVTITVDSLSPFMVSILEEKKATPTETTTPTTKPTNNEKDETPKTGTTDIITYVVATTIFASIGLIALKKRSK